MHRCRVPRTLIGRSDDRKVQGYLEQGFGWLVNESGFSLSLDRRRRFKLQECLWRGIEKVERAATMTCRIERVEMAERPVILRISGQIAGREVDLLRSLLEQETKAPVLDLKDLLLVDRKAVKLLALRESNGVELRNCSAYIREWITKERLNRSMEGRGKDDGEENDDV